MSKDPSPHHPKFNAMLVCDVTLRDAETGKVSLIGIFSDVRALSFPVLQPSLSVYLNLSDVQGDYDLKIELRRLDDDRLVGEGGAGLSLDRPNAEIVFEMRNLVFPTEGRYEFRVHANDRFVGNKPFNVVKVPVK
jgi:hypothetical protein